MKTFCFGDIHGAYHALLECLKLSQFEKGVDRLICLGDVCDRGPLVRECIDELISIPHCILILGNHDAWGLQWALEGLAPEDWLQQGGEFTVQSYQSGMPQTHIDFLSQAHPYFIDRNRLFVHGGFDPNCPVQQTPKEFFIWDRELIKHAHEFQQFDPGYKFGDYDEVYVGHTPTQGFGSAQPLKLCNVWAMDTGAGHGNKLTIMDIDTKQFWQANAF